MFKYQLQVTTGQQSFGGTYDYVFLTLIGKEGESERTELKTCFGFRAGTTEDFTVKTTSSLGELLLIRVEKDPFLVFPEDEWYCSTIVVRTEGGEVLVFPCYRWICRGDKVELRGGRALKVSEEDHDLLTEHRQKELTFRKSLYQWDVLVEGLPHRGRFDDVSQLPTEVHLSAAKANELSHERFLVAMELKLKGIIGSKESWESIDDMANIYWTNRTPMSGISLQIKLLIFISSMLQRNVVIWCPPVNSTLNRSFWFMLTHETEVG
uniref:PLAT domain-containing protein n=1 Tax=Cynoglossus semilaevis TaxID=244447 RepID=A0A3P8VYI1_CYNSE